MPRQSLYKVSIRSLYGLYKYLDDLVKSDLTKNDLMIRNNVSRLDWIQFLPT